MKLKLIILLFLFSVCTYSQKGDLCRPEIWTAVDNVPSALLPVTFTFNKFYFGSVYCHALNDHTDWFFCTSCDPNPRTIVIRNDPESLDRGFTACSEDLYNVCQEDNFGYTVYKVTCSLSEKYFYLNFLDNCYWSNLCGPYSSKDFQILFDYASNGNFFWKLAGETNWIQIANGELINTWTMFNRNEPLTSYFPNFWQNCLFEDHTSNNPLLIWSKYPGSELGTIIKYNVYRTLPDGTVLWIGTTTSSVFQFIDYSYTFDLTPGDMFYKIKAVNASNQSSAFSNSVPFAGYIDWAHALFLTNDGGIPRLAWGPYEGEILGYNVYRKAGGGAFIKINPNLLPPSTYEYWDMDYGITPDGISLQYYLKAMLDPSGYDSTNTVSTTGLIILKDLSEPSNYNYSLSSNYPNPFNPKTRINYSIRKAGNVKLEVFDIYGSRVTTLVDKIQKEGEYSADFDGSSGSCRISSGIYIYRIQAGE